MIGHFSTTSGNDTITNLRAMTTPAPRSAAGPVTVNAFERLVQIMNGNERMAAELEVARGRIVRARAALATPAGNTRLNAQYLEHCKTKHRGILAQLRANRIEANGILGLEAGEGRAASRK